MPEGLEAEIYRRTAATCIGRTIDRVDVDESQPEARALQWSLPGASITDVRRHGKLVIVDLTSCADGGPLNLGLHFGMTGRLVVDGASAIERLEYSSHRDDPAWDRLRIEFVGGGVLRVNDPRRWAKFTMMPDSSHLGPDVLSVTRDDFTVALHGRTRALKALLLDQSLIAGFGNMCVDEVLWHAALDPHRPGGLVTRREIGRLWKATVTELPAMLQRGGSHTGTIDPQLRAVGGRCPKPRCRGVLRRSVVGGRTTIWCPTHQM
jgi:formamidopyrimidine-DNA glycosylase